MKKTITMLMFVLAGCLFASAQGDMSSGSMKDKKTDHDGKMISMTGCIAEKDGTYMMMDKKHPDGVQLMSSEDLKPHIGHKVKVSGMMEKSDMAGSAMKSDDKMAADDKMKSDDKMMKSDDKMMKSDDKMMKHDHMGAMAMKVSSMKMVSEQCDMPKASK